MQDYFYLNFHNFFVSHNDNKGNQFNSISTENQINQKKLHLTFNK